MYADIVFGILFALTILCVICRNLGLLDSNYDNAKSLGCVDLVKV